MSSTVLALGKGGRNKTGWPIVSIIGTQSVLSSHSLLHELLLLLAVLFGADILLKNSVPVPSLIHSIKFSFQKPLGDFVDYSWDVGALFSMFYNFFLHFALTNKLHKLEDALVIY